MLTFLLAALVTLGGALGVVLLRNTVHNALSLIATLFGIAILFMTLDAYFLAAVQVIVYAGAVVVLFLFVIMLLGVDKLDQLEHETFKGQRSASILVGIAVLGLSLTALLSVGSVATGRMSSLAANDPTVPDINGLARVIFTDYVFAFEITSVLLTIAVVGAVVLARRGGSVIDLDEFPDGPAETYVPAPTTVDPADIAPVDGGDSDADEAVDDADGNGDESDLATVATEGEAGA